MAGRLRVAIRQVDTTQRIKVCLSKNIFMSLSISPCAKQMIRQKTGKSKMKLVQKYLDDALK